MDERLLRRKLKFYLRLNYPLRVVMDADGARGSYPDLPGCEAQGESLADLKQRLEELRRSYLVDAVRAGDDPPMPNSHLAALGESRRAGG